MRQLGPGAKPNAISPSAGPGALPQTAAERSENERLRDRLEKALQVNQLLYNFLEKHTQNQFQTRDATELEAGRLAKELEKAQMHLAKQQEANESTRIEFERMSAELNRLQERLERSEAEKEALKQQGHGGSRQNMQAQQHIEKNLLKLEAETKQLTVERYVYDPAKRSRHVFDHFSNKFSLQQRPIDSTTGKESRYANELPTRTKCHRTRVAASARGKQTVR